MCFLLADIEGSTALVRRSDDAYRAALEDYRGLTGRVVEAGGGTVVEAEGDSVLAVFSAATDAITTASALHRALAAHPFPGGFTVRARVGVHAGPAQPHDGVYVALAVHQTSRVTDTAHGGQTVVTELARLAAGPDLDAGALVEWGAYWLRGFDQPVTLWQPAAGGDRAVGFPALRVAVPARGLGLDLDVTSFLGRDREEAELAGLLERRRVVTVVGPGGAGKSRLAREVARHRAGPGTEIRLVELALIRGPSAVAGAVAGAVGIKLDDGPTPEAALVEHLRRTAVILLLDDCDHLAGPVARLVGDLVAACPGLRVLATSRAPLGVPGEHLLRLAPLPPEAAVELFAARAEEHGWRPAGPGDRENIVELCARLDSLPLAVEMAAGWTTAMTLTELVALIEQAPAALEPTVPRPGDGERHRSLASVVELSHRLLDPGEQSALARLSVLRDRFDLATAAVVLDERAPASVAPASRLLRSLVDRSLVMVERQGERSLYHLHAVVRSFAAGYLDRAEQAACLVRLGRWFCTRLEDRPSDRRWLDEVAGHLGNLTGVIDGLLTVDDRLAARLALLVAHHNWSRSDTWANVDQLVAWAAALTRPTVESLSLIGQVTFEFTALGRHDDARAWLARHAQVSEDLGASDPRFPHELLRGFLALQTGDPVAARAEIGTYLDRVGTDDAEPRRGRMMSWWVSSAAHLVLHDLVAAEADSLRALDLARQLGDRLAVTQLAGNLVELRAARLGRQSQARNYLRWRGEQMEFWETEVPLLIDPAAWVALELGRHGDAARLLRVFTEGAAPNRFHLAGNHPDDMVAALNREAPGVWAAVRARPPLSVEDAVLLARDVLTDPRLPPGDDLFEIS